MNFLIQNNLFWRLLLPIRPVQLSIAPMVIAALAAAATQGFKAYQDHRAGNQAANQARQQEAAGLRDERARRARMRAVAEHYGVQLPDNIWGMYLNPTSPSQAPRPGFDWLGTAMNAGSAAAGAAGQAHAASQQDDIIDQFLQGRKPAANPYAAELDPLNPQSWTGGGRRG